MDLDNRGGTMHASAHRSGSSDERSTPLSGILQGERGSSAGLDRSSDRMSCSVTFADTSPWPINVVASGDDPRAAEGSHLVEHPQGDRSLGEGGSFRVGAVVCLILHGPLAELGAFDPT